MILRLPSLAPPARFVSLGCASLLALGLLAGCGDDDSIPTGAGPGAGGASS